MYLPLFPGDFLGSANSRARPTARQIRDTKNPPAIKNFLLEASLLHIIGSLIFDNSNFVLDCGMILFVSNVIQRRFTN